jgi:hypothetical protein
MSALPLRISLSANAAFSALSGVTLMLAPEAISELLANAPVPAIEAVGAGLLLFAMLVSWVASRPAPDPAAVTGISVADIGWVVLSAVALIAYGPRLTAAGALAIGGAAVVVLLFAAAQLVSMLRTARVAPGRYRHCIVIEAPLPPDALWAKVSDIGHIAYYAHGLRTSLVEPRAAPQGEPVRYCEDHAGRSWRERCQLQPDRRSLGIHFLSDEPGFPFPMAQMEGRWSVEPSAHGARVTVRWEFTPRPQWASPFILAALAWQAGRAMPRVVDNMCRSAPATGKRRKPAVRRVADAC